ncbi:SOS response-associated peptidase family protein [Acinetobacter puyangensis]|nr:SOS response-associated peptidase family protein [Acinetobacter puyangensis]
MCANFKPIAKIQAYQLDMFEPTFDYRDDIYPGYTSPIIFKSESGWEWREAQFGLVPKWTDDKKFSRFTYNARTETVASKPSFRESWARSQFCLIPVQKIYEPKYINGKAHSYGIERKDGEIFTIAGLYEITKIEDEIIRSFTMLTVNAEHHDMMKQFHKPEDEKRSVVVVPKDLRDDWLSSNKQNAGEFFKLFDIEQYKQELKP